MQLIGTLMLSDPPAQEPLESEETMADEQETTVKEYEKRGTKAALLPLNFEKRNGHPHAKEEGLNFKPSEVLKSKYFYMLWIIFLFNGQGITFISTLYKAYGQTFIKNDSFLALVGSFSAIFNSFGRIWWGFLADKTSFRVAMMVSCASFTCLMLTFQVTAVLGRGVFFIYVCLLFGSFSGSFSLLPTATAKCFGREYLSMNYGLVFTAQVVTSPLGAFLSQQLISAIGWTGLFFLVSGFSFLSLLVAIMFRAKDRYGEEI
ncbi:oxalate:formate antiporter [Plakobranchus ocellatus]|uniref:Oxalate:formate antiporter n=1 Tax=Plakobranchus ocellatus TaxID=259542 RepID=A0AAV3Z2X9_9GAST|nr:oxalate:formate antiporter [Plakobranchus ocellatus]